MNLSRTSTERVGHESAQGLHARRPVQQAQEQSSDVPLPSLTLSPAVSLTGPITRIHLSSTHRAGSQGNRQLQFSSRPRLSVSTLLGLLASLLLLFSGAAVVMLRSQVQYSKQAASSPSSVYTSASQLRTGLTTEFQPMSQVPGLKSDATYLQLAHEGPFPMRLKYPVLWAGAFLSRTGYGTEAVSYVSALLQLGLVSGDDLWLAQSGDYVFDVVVNTMAPELLQLIRDQNYHNVTKKLSAEQRQRPVIVVCHSFPDCWRTPLDDHPSLATRLHKWIEPLWKRYVLRRRASGEDGCPCPPEDIKNQVVYRVGRTMFETELLPAPLAAFSRYVHEVWVPSEFNRASFTASGVDPLKLRTLAQGVNTTLFNPQTQLPLDLASLGGDLVAGVPWEEERGAQGGEEGGVAGTQRTPIFRFLSVFKWEARKGWDILLRAYVSEFKADEPVELHIMTKEAFEKVDNFVTYIRRVAAPLLNISAHDPLQWAALPRIVVHHKHVPEPQYPRVYRSMDALVIPTHGEGWGRPQIEAMAMGLPVISTNWSGLTAFMDEDVAFPIRVAGVVPVTDSGPASFEWFASQRWAQPDEGHLRELMRGCVTSRAAAEAKGAAARQRVLKEFSEQAVATKLLAQLLRLQDVVEASLAPPSTARTVVTAHAAISAISVHAAWALATSAAWTETASAANAALEEAGDAKTVSTTLEGCLGGDADGSGCRGTARASSVAGEGGLETVIVGGEVEAGGGAKESRALAGKEGARAVGATTFGNSFGGRRLGPGDGRWGAVEGRAARHRPHSWAERSRGAVGAVRARWHDLTLAWDNSVRRTHRALQAVPAEGLPSMHEETVLQQAVPEQAVPELAAAVQAVAEQAVAGQEVLPANLQSPPIPTQAMSYAAVSDAAVSVATVISEQASLPPLIPL